MLGDDTFRASIRRYYEEHLHGTASTDDLRNALAHVTDHERFANEFFASYITGQKLPGYESLLANAGIEGDVKPIVEYDEEMFDKVISVNVKGVWLGIKSSIDAMKQRGGGSIVIPRRWT